MTGRWGLTFPLAGVPLWAHESLARALPDWGYTDVWTSEVSGADAFTPLALTAAWAPSLRLGTAVVPVFTRGPGLIAMSAASLAEVAPGRFTLGLGASSETIVRDWNGLDFAEPLARTRDVLRIVRSALAGDRVSEALGTLTVSGLRLERPPRVPPPILLAALRPRMLRLAGTDADGVVLNWLAGTDVARCWAEVANPGATVAARIFVCPTDDAEHARAIGRRLIAAYLTVPAYAAFHDWLGRGDALAGMRAAWEQGDRRGAAAAIPDEVVDALVVHGTPERCVDQVREYVAAGVDVPILALVGTPEMTTADAVADTVRRLGPADGT